MLSRLMLASVTALALLIPISAQAEPIPTGKYVLSLVQLIGVGPNGGHAFEILTQTTVETSEECLAKSTDFNVKSAIEQNAMVSVCHEQVVEGTRS